ncbi:Csu type fimbrial protein [Lysobacter fragariae]
MKSSNTALLALALFAAGAPSAYAANAAANFGVQLIVQNSCTITAGNGPADMDFLTVTGNIATNIDAQTDLTVNCNNNALYHVGLNDGLHAAAGQRRMFSAATGDFVNYDLFTTSGRTVRWGVTAAGGTATDVDGTGTNANQTLTVYGRVPGAPVQSVGAGTYNDTIIATVEF